MKAKTSRTRYIKTAYGRGAKLVLGCASVLSALLAYGFLNGQSQVAPASLAAVDGGDTTVRNIMLPEAKVSKDKTNEAKQSAVLFNDPFIQLKWGLEKTAAKQAWEITQGSKDIVVAVIDTGIDKDHPDLAENLWVNPGESGKDKNGHDKANNGIDDDANGFIDDVHGWNFVSTNNQLNDYHGHGTHIAGIIGARGGGSFGVSGVSPHVSLMVLKYYDPKVSNSNNLKNTIQAIHYAVKMKANIINYSGGGTDYSAEEFAAVKEAEKAGILFVAAAGNERSNSDENGKHYFPADYGLSNIISVTAVSKGDTKVLASSNYGVRTVDIAAPGENIYSTLPNNSFGLMTGTSQATAFVTGVAALIMAHEREFTYTDVKKYILRTGDEYATLLSKTGSAKLLNSYKALTSFDMGVGVSGVMATNTAHVGGAFASDQNIKDPANINTSALNSAGDEGQDPAESIAMFGKEFLKAARVNPTAPEVETHKR